VEENHQHVCSSTELPHINKNKQGPRNKNTSHGICKKNSNIYHLPLTPPGSDEILEEGEKAVLEPPMSLTENDKREVCPLHGWVGRRAFQCARHDLCEAPEADAVEEPEEDTEPEEDIDESPNKENADESSEEDDDESSEEDLKSKAESTGEVTPGRKTVSSGRSSARRCGIPPKKTLAVRRITRLELATGRAELKALGADAPYERPRTRGDCAQVPRPCPYVACKYSLYLDVSSTGSIILNFPHLEPGQMPAERSCALDLAESGPMTLEHVAVVTNLTRERIRQIELRALIRRGRSAAVALGLGPEHNDPSEATNNKPPKKP
jgi:hypothetical protein